MCSRRATAPLGKRAVVIGINYKGTSAQLNGCINDADNICDQLLLEGYRESDVRVMVDNSPKNRRPTRKNIIGAIDWLVKGAKAGETLWFSYSGHGTHTRDWSGEEVDGRDEALCPLDYQRAGLISDDYLRKHLVDRVPAGVKLVVILDCCHSGTGLDLRWNYEDRSTRAKRTHRFNLHDWNLVQTCREDRKIPRTHASVVCLSGCHDSQVSMDTVFDNQAVGALTYAFLSAVQDARIRGRTITCEYLLKYVSCFLKQNNYQQRPQLSTGTRVPLGSTRFAF